MELEGDDILALDAERLRARRREMQIIFQDPYAALDPRLTAYYQIAEPMTVHGIDKGSALRERVIGMLTGFAADDAHFHSEDSFGGWVMVKAERNEPDALLEALKAGRYYASQGPEILSVQCEDDHLLVETSPVRSILPILRAAAHGLTPRRLIRGWTSVGSILLRVMARTYLSTWG